MPHGLMVIVLLGTPVHPTCGSLLGLLETYVTCQLMLTAALQSVVERSISKVQAAYSIGPRL